MHRTATKLKILAADDDKLIRAMLQRHLGYEHTVILASCLKDAVDILQKEVVDIAFVDLNLDDSLDNLTGIKLISQIREDSPATIVIAMTGLQDAELIAKAYDRGASDYVFKPIVPKTLNLIVRRAVEVHKLLTQNRSLRSQAGELAAATTTLTTKAPAFKTLLDQARKLIGTRETILIRGESGTGKDVFAKYLWSLEGDKSRPFIAVNCGAITANLAESELFGHRAGAFSGATQNRIGRLEEANGGDLFLDEIATLPMEIQVKLLRFLNDGEITPLGQNSSKKVICRIIAATNESLEELVKARTFREDVLFRVRQITLTMPPLRERKEDIPDLIAGFLVARGHAGKTLAGDALQFCMEYNWPGNIRELRDTICAAALFAEGDKITLADLHSQIKNSADPASTGEVPAVLQSLDPDRIKGNFNKLTSDFEQQLVRHALKAAGSDSAAAKYLGLPRSTLRSRLRTWGWS